MEGIVSKRLHLRHETERAEQQQDSQCEKRQDDNMREKSARHEETFWNDSHFCHFLMVQKYKKMLFVTLFVTLSLKRPFHDIFIANITFFTQT